MRPHVFFDPSDAKRSGVYSIINFDRGLAYIGSAVNLTKRYREHFNKLTRNAHENRKLQSLWNESEKDQFHFFVLEFVDDKSKLLEVEQFWLDKSLGNRSKTLNILWKADSTLGFRFSDEAKLRMSKARKGRKLGPQSPSHRLANRLARLGVKKGPQSAEDRAKKSVALMGNQNAKGAVRSPETRARMSAAQKKRFGREG